VLLVAHRPSTARLADHVVVLDGGKVAQSGTHDALGAQAGLYCDLIGSPPENAANAAPQTVNE